MGAHSKRAGNTKGELIMIELKENDLVKVVGKDNKVRLTTIERVELNTDCPYITHDIFFNNNYESQGKRFEIIAVWRYNEETGNYLKIYDKDMPYINDPKFRNKPCKLAEPADVPYDKYIALEHENEELRNIIVELNKKLYESNQIH
jgi:hypothetical protein